MKTLVHKNTTGAFALIEALVVVGTMFLLILLLLPSLAWRQRALRVGCVNNLKWNGLAFRQYALDHAAEYPWQVSSTNGGTMELAGNASIHFQLLSNYLRDPKPFLCPADKYKTAATSFASNFSNANVSYFIGLDADATAPAMILAGDDNLAVGGVRAKPGILELWTNSAVAWTADRHGGSGNIALSDGSVQGVGSPKLLLQRAGPATNRLVMP